jgi:hypothetical protein
MKINPTNHSLLLCFLPAFLSLPFLDYFYALWSFYAIFSLITYRLECFPARINFVILQRRIISMHMRNKSSEFLADILDWNTTCFLAFYTDVRMFSIWISCFDIYPLSTF